MKPTKATIARTLVLVLALGNQILTMSGKNPLPFSDDQVYTACTAVLTIGASVLTWWKNNSFTAPAIAADSQMKQDKKQIEESK